MRKVWGERIDFSAKRITSELEKSLERLHTDVLISCKLMMSNSAIFARLLRKRSLRYIGITGYSLKNLIEIASRVKVDNILTYCRYNLLIDDMEKTLVPFAKAHDISVVNASPLHMGIITKHGAPVWHPAPQEVREVGQQIVKLCTSRDYDASELGLKYCFSNKNVASTLVGISTEEHVDASLKALQMKDDAELLGDIAELVGPVHNFVWPSGLAENHD
jgi:L-galactose dehydrogenase